MQQGGGCVNSVIKNIFKNTQTEQLTKNVDLIYYPKAGYVAISHVELNVDGKVWDGTAGYHLKNDYEVVERKAMTGGKAFYRFKLRATDQEVEQLQNYCTVF